jgi:hypothetical protein
MNRITRAKTAALDIKRYLLVGAKCCLAPIKEFMSFSTRKIKGVTKISRNKRPKLRLYRMLPESQPNPVAIIYFWLTMLDNMLRTPSQKRRM